MATYTEPRQRKQEDSERLRGEKYQIQFIDLGFERWQVVGLIELCWGKAMVAHTKPQRRKKEESERLG